MVNRFRSAIYIAFGLALLGAWGCKKNTFNINDVNPNVPSDVSPKFILSGALVNTAAWDRGGNTDPIELYMGYWSVSGDYIPQTQTLTYNTSTDYTAGNWDNGYLILKNFRQMEFLASKDPNAGNYTAIAKIMESYIYARLVDMFNNIPYTQSLQGGIINFPTFQDGSTIYPSLLQQLDTAITIINTVPPTAEIPGTFDVMFGGSMTTWVQFANTIKLKIVMNLTQTATGPATITSTLAGLTPASFLGPGQDAAINPGYSNSSEAQQNPFYFDMGFATSGAAQNNESYYRAADFIVNFMYATRDTLRLYQMFAANAQSPSIVLGRPFGSNVSVGQDNQHISGLGPGLLQTASSPAVILPASESLFRQAEATFDGYLPGGVASATTLYQMAIEESFRSLQVPNYIAAADNFIASNTSPDVNPNPLTLEAIIMQEWVAVSGVDPLDSWNNWRRLQIPRNLPVSQFSGSTATHVPYRFLYPTSEYSYNSTNVAAEGTINNLTSKIFWMP